METSSEFRAAAAASFFGQGPKTVFFTTTTPVWFTKHALFACALFYNQVVLLTWPIENVAFG